MKLKKEVLRVGQTPGAVAEAGGQSMLSRGMDNVLPTSLNVNPYIKEVVMKSDDFPVKGGCGHSDEELLFSSAVCALCLIAGAVFTALAPLIR